jgi:O-Antigen ligase
MLRIQRGGRRAPAVRLPVTPEVLTVNALAAASAVLVAIVITPPDIVLPYTHMLRKLLVLVFAAGLTIWLPVELFLGLSVLVLATSSAVGAVSVGPIQFYTYDMVLALVLLRAALPRARSEDRLSLVDPGVAFPLVLWAIVMGVAGLRGILAGNPLGAIARLETPLVYFPVFCWGFRRILREESVSPPRVVRAIVLTSVGLVAYAAWARLTHHRFGNSSGSGIGVVPTATGDLRRDYGFFSAFEVYPLLALGGIAYVLFAPKYRYNAMLVAMIGAAATFLTLVRGLIFGIVAGTAWLIVLLTKRGGAVRLGSRLAPFVALFSIAAVAFSIYSPVAARGTVERVLPGLTSQSEVATESAHIRERAFRNAIRIAWDKPLGVGFQKLDKLQTVGYDPGRIPENQWAAMLVFTGWPGIVLLLWAGIAVVRRSAQLPESAPWLHPFVAATAILVAIQGFAWNVVFSQTWSLGLIALVLALRLALGPTPRPESVGRVS